jgi:hypothetical protein
MNAPLKDGWIKQVQQSPNGESVVTALMELCSEGFFLGTLKIEQSWSVTQNTRVT